MPSPFATRRAPGNRLSLLGKQFGRLTVIGSVGTVKRKSRWTCKCECGKGITTDGGALTSGNTTSCGCGAKDLLVKRNTKHGYHGTRTYRAWQAMLNRCRNPKVSGYENYGGRGIKVCKQWLKFPSFLRAMGECPEGMRLERIDTDGNYEKSNCRWAVRFTHRQMITNLITSMTEQPRKDHRDSTHASSY